MAAQSLLKRRHRLPLRLVGAAGGGASPAGSVVVGASCSMPASASASASSASICSAVGAAITCTTDVSGSITSVVPSGSSYLAGADRGADLHALDVDLQLGGMLVASASTESVFSSVLSSRRARSRRRCAAGPRP